ncbi:uncharacterized protein LOC115875092 isoform X1 [Sitophilus oryzae]|uniref:Uncharacterized protein LOC115875092 isoform X1 n=1 Tax=Sitophilus oryzae TaxID=7048 RepID=A0A6J2X5Y9_SITOR|nr:uncharacterized protein LOC115875092 isoform X1 [Sitophilus oryzae]
MFAETDDSLHQPSVRIVEFEKKGPNCGFHLTRGKWDPYPWVSQVDDDSVSNLAGLKPGDCLLEVNDEDIVGKKICEIAELVKNKTGKVSLLVWNAGVDPHCSPEALCCGPIPNNLTRLSACMSTILAFLECPVCLETIFPPTYQCDNGHLICIRCRAKSERCPVCRLRFNRGRSLISDQVYNSVVEAFDLKEENKDNTAQKIQQIFKPKPKNKIIPNIKVTQCHTNNFLSKLMGKSSSVDNLSSNFKFLSPNDSETMKIKSLSSNEIFQAETPTVSRAGSILKLSRRKDNNTTTMDDSLTNISDFEDRPASFHGSVEFLDNHLSERSDTNEELCKNQLTFHCPFQSKCTSLIKENEIMQHFETNHEGPLVQYFGKTIQISIRKLDNENCFMINNAGCTYFVKTYANSEVTLGDSSTSDIFLWCWYLGTKIGAKSFELEVELKTTSLKMPFFRVRSPISSLHSTSFYDIKEFNKGIFLNSETIKSLGCVDDIILNISIIPTDV